MQPPPGSSSPFADKVDAFFCITERGSTIGTEIRSGLVTFVTMAYIIFVNPQILALSGTPLTGGDMPFGSIATATALSAAVGSLGAGLLGNLPFGLAPGMGLNSYFTYGVCLRMGLTWQVALTTVFVQGILFMLLSVSGLCSMIQRYAPACIKKSITVGLGLFQALIGLECMRLVVRGREVLLGLGDLSDPGIWLSLSGVLIISVLLVLKFKGAMLCGILLVTLVAWITGLEPHPTGVLRWPELSGTLWQLDFEGYFAHWTKSVAVTLVFLFVSIFDTAGVQFAAGSQAGLLDESHHLPKSSQAFFAAGLATTVGAAMGTSPVIIHNETCAGIQDGARTGLSAVTVAVCFIIALPFSPIFEAVPAIAGAPPLVVVGMFMMACAKYIDWESIDEGMPAFVVVTMLPFTYSIANGMLFGLATYALIKGSTLAIQLITGDHKQEIVPVLADPVPGSPMTPYITKRRRLSAPCQEHCPDDEHNELSPILRPRPSSHGVVHGREVLDTYQNGRPRAESNHSTSGSASSEDLENGPVAPWKLAEIRRGQNSYGTL